MNGRKVALLLVLVLGLGAQYAFRRTATLTDAQIAQEIPVFPGAKLRDMGGGLLGNDINNMDTRSRTWWLTFDAPHAKVVRFYEQELGKTATVDEEGAKVFEVSPPSAYDDEQVTITILGDSLTINEQVRLRRKPKA